LIATIVIIIVSKPKVAQKAEGTAEAGAAATDEIKIEAEFYSSFS
jgi:hypothetical protein